MHPTAALIVLVFIILLLAAGIWYCTESILNSLPYRIGYVSSNVSLCTQNLKGIIEKYVPDPSQVSYIEPGAGLANITRWAAETYPWKEIIALDLNYSLLAIARLLSRKTRRPIWYVRKNIFDFTYPKNSFIYCYLSVPMLERLHASKKLAGCLVVTLTFAIPGVTPTEEIPLGNWQKRLLVYDFRTTS